MRTRWGQSCRLPRLAAAGPRGARGIEYVAFEYRTWLAALGIVQSMNRPGKPTDNAHMESF